MATKSEDKLGKKICSVKAVAEEGCDPHLKAFLKCLMFSTSNTCSSEWATLKDCLMNQGLVKARGHLGKSSPDSTKAMPKVSSQIDTAEVVFVARCVRDYEGEETCSIQTTGAHSSIPTLLYSPWEKKFLFKVIQKSAVLNLRCKKVCQNCK